MLHSTSRRALMLAGSIVIPTLIPSLTLSQIRGEARNFTLSYQPGSATRNGYADAQLQLQYSFAACPGPHLLVRSPDAVHMLVGNHRYWFEGKLREVPPTIAPPKPELNSVRGTVRGPNVVKTVSMPYLSSSPSCGFNGLPVAEASAAFPPKATDEEKVRILNQFGFDHEQSLGTLTSAAVESHFREQIAEARRDSTRRAQAARTDSINRARAAASAQATQSGSTPGAAAGAAAGAAGASAAGAASAGSSDAGAGGNAAAAPAAPQKTPEQAAAEVRAAIAQKQADDAARSAQIDAATQEVAGMFVAAMAQDRARKEARAAREAAAFQAYMARISAAFAAMPPRPQCSASHLDGEIAFDAPTAGVIDGSECRLADQTSAKRYTVKLTTRGRVEIALSAGFYGELKLTRGPDTTVVADRVGQIATMLEPGEYTITIHPRYPGETGTYTVRVGRGTYSNVDGGQIAMFVDAGSAQIDAGDAPEFAGNFIGFRVGAGSALFKMIGEFYGSAKSEDAFMGMELGARSYLGSRHSKLRPFLHATWGYRDINQITMSLDGYQADGHGYTYGAGFDWFAGPRGSFEFGLFTSNGTMDGAKYSSTRLRVGMAAHRSRCGWRCD